MTTCPECGDRKERISQHWAMSSCGYPEIVREQREILDGLMLAGATVAGTGNNRHLRIGTTSKDLAGWTAEQLGWLHHGTRVEADDGNREDMYRIRTPAHPACNRYERWGDDGRAPPDDYQLTARTGRVWWAYAGGLQWPGEYDSQRTATISALDDSRARWIQRVLATVAIDATRAGKRVQWHGQQIRDWLTFIGDAVPGAAHKWATTIVEYRTIRDDEPGIDEEVTRAKHALDVAAERLDRVDREAFKQVINDVSADYVAEMLGGDDFEDALSVAGIQRRVEKGSKDVEVSGRGPEYTGDELRAALAAWAEGRDLHLYTDYRKSAKSDPDLPAAETQAARFGSWGEAVESVIGDDARIGRGYWDRETMLDALAEWFETTNSPHTTTAYRSASTDNPFLPVIQLVYDEFGSWSAAKKAVRTSGNISNYR